MNRYRFRPKLWVSVLACLGILAGLALGNWQLNRAQEKIALQRTLEQADRQLVVSVPSSAADPKTFNLRHVEANGNFVPEHTIYLDNKMHSGMVGYNVITPLRIAQSQKYVLVNRGWIKAGDSRENLPPLLTPTDSVRIYGIAMIPTKKFFELSEQTVSGKLWQNLVIERYQKSIPLDIHGFVIQQQSPLDDGLIRDWEPIDTGITKHRGYAFQWFALAALIFIIYIVSNVKRNSNP